MYSYCDLSAELDLQETSCESTIFCPELYSNSTYYEENTPYNEISEPYIERCKNIKTKQQSCSPVEIRQESTLNIDLPPILWHNYGSIPKILNVINTGRTVLINGQWPESRPYITGGPLNGNYIFSQIHFHSPSEHEINGKRYPLEMHVVHYKTSYLTQERAMGEKDGTVVVVYLFEVLHTDSSILSSITNSIHLIEGVNDRTELTDVALNQILQPVFSNYYIYWGSVSTSKNSYSLQWIVSCTNLCVTQKEMDKLIKILSSNESLAESQASQMNIINNIIYHVEGYDLPPEANCNASNVTPKCYCRYHCQNCKTCVIHAEESRPFYFTEPYSCGSKELDKRDVELQTSLCEKTSKSTSKSSLCNCKQIQKEIKKFVEFTSASSCSSANSDSKSSTCVDKKKFKKKKSTKKMPSCFSNIANCENSDDQTLINSMELKTCSSCASTDENVNTNFCVKSKNLKEKDQKVKRKNVQKSETSSCETLKNSSKSSLKNPKTPKKKKIAENISEDSKSNKSSKKEKEESKQKKIAKSDSSVGSSKNSESVKREKKKKEDKKAENCDLQMDVQCMPVLISTDKIEEKLLETKSKSLEENKEEEKMEESKKEIEELLVVCEKLLEPPKNLSEDKPSVCSELDNNLKTIFEAKRVFGNSASPGNDYAVNFVLSPNTLQSECSPLTSESKCLEVSKNVDSKQNTAVKESINKVPELEVSTIGSPEHWKDISFETEHFFRTEKKGDFAECITQEYNLAVICNRNIIQEFRGVFHPKTLKLGIYEKLHLIPKYPELENESIRVDDCFVKKESMDQLYIRVKFLLNKAKINDIGIKSKNSFEEEIKLPYLELSDVKNNKPDPVEEEKPQRDDKAVNEINTEQSDLKTKVLEKEEYKAELLKKPDSDLKQGFKNIAFDCLQQSFELMKEEQKKENSLNETTDKTITDLFHKRRKVYFSCEKIEKDENSGKNVFVGSFRTQKELKALSKDKKVVQEADVASLAQKSSGGHKEKSSSPSEKSREKLVKTANSKTKSKCKSQSPAKSSEPNKSNESKNIITLHKHKPKK